MFRVKTFVGYQISSSHHSPGTFRALMSALDAALQNGTPRIQLDVSYGEFPPGARLWDEITKAIHTADITFFDVSENNPNVLLEVGIAVGAGKHVVLTKCDGSLPGHPLPSDLRSFVYLPYSQERELVTPIRVDDVAKGVRHFVDNAHTIEFYHRALWSLESDSRTLLIPGRLPQQWTGNRFEDYIRLRRLTDLDAVIMVFETLHRLYPGMEVVIHPARTIAELPKNWQECNLVIIGGPDFNPIVREFDAPCPLEYGYGPADDEVWLRHKRTGTTYRPVFTEVAGVRRATDYGFFFKTALVPELTSKLVLLGGARTWGVYGAAMLVGCTSRDKRSEGYSNARLLVQSFGTDPSLLVPVEVSGSEDGIRSPKWNVGSVEVM